MNPQMFDNHIREVHKPNFGGYGQNADNWMVLTIRSTGQMDMVTPECHRSNIWLSSPTQLMGIHVFHLTIITDNFSTMPTYLRDAVLSLLTAGGSVHIDLAGFPAK